MELDSLRIISNPVLVRDYAVDKLRSALATGLYKPGDRIIDRDLCETLQISRTSVREALRQLQAEKLITVGPRRRISVTVLTADDAADIYLLRETLEGEAVSRFVERAQEEDVQSLSSLYQAMRKAVDNQDIPQLVPLSNQFTETILKGCGSDTIHSFGMQLLHRVGYLKATAMAEPNRVDVGFDELGAVVKAVNKRDAKAAKKAMIDHIRKASEAIAAHLRAAPQAPKTQAKKSTA